MTGQSFLIWVVAIVDSKRVVFAVPGMLGSFDLVGLAGYLLRSFQCPTHTRACQCYMHKSTHVMHIHHNICTVY